MMRVLVACEESQTVCKAFRERGFEAYSCDIEPCSGGHPEWHIQDDVLKHLDENWDLIIAHPPCTYLSVSGNSWFNISKYGEKALQRIELREDAIKFFEKFTDLDCRHIAIENPIGVMSTRYRKPDQIIEPWMFGEEASKKTCLWLKNLPILHPTKIVGKGEHTEFISGRRMPKWYADCWSLPPAERSRIRSMTFKGIAQAMAAQWGDYIY